MAWMRRRDQQGERGRRRSWWWPAAVSVVAFGAAAAGVPSASAAPRVCHSWDPTGTPDEQALKLRPARRHWNGSQWTIEPSPNINNEDNGLSGIATAGGTAFAVGDYRDGSRTHSLIEHFG